MGKKKQSDSGVLTFRIMMISMGSVALAMGWLAQSQGILWNTGRNPRTGHIVSTPTASWIAMGILMLLAGVFPWKWLSDRLERLKRR
jgi:hypothetical protein